MVLAKIVNSAAFLHEVHVAISIEQRGSQSCPSLLYGNDISNPAELGCSQGLSWIAMVYQRKCFLG
jgi:hypothetical protein